MAENFPNLKETDIKIQESQRAPDKMNPNMPKTLYNKNGKKLKIKRRFQRQQEKSKALITREPK